MKTILTILLAAIVSGGESLAQNVAGGKKYLYYERYQSAKDQFEKVLA